MVKWEEMEELFVPLFLRSDSLRHLATFPLPIQLLLNLVEDSGPVICKGRHLTSLISLCETTKRVQFFGMAILCPYRHPILKIFPV